MSGIPHDHHHSIPDLSHTNRAFYIGISLNALFTLIEFAVGYSNNALALIADASHNLSDVAGLLLSLLGIRLAQKAANYSYTYGYKKISILASILNAVLLLFMVGHILLEAISRFKEPTAVSGPAMIITALIGFFVNALSASLFYRNRHSDMNIKMALMHLVADALVSLGVVFSGLIIYYTHWRLIDPIISIVIAFVVFLSTWHLLRESIRLILDAVPRELDLDQLKEILSRHPSVARVDHLHVWALSSSENALTVHLSLKEHTNTAAFVAIKNELKAQLKIANIQHATIELDDLNESSIQLNCPMHGSIQ